MAVTVGTRLSFGGSLCTVRYIGPVQGTKGDWYGVEWDDPSRGKHPGEHQGVRYFQCKSRRQPTAGSFIRPAKESDKPLSFLEAAHEKYVSERDTLKLKDAQGLSSSASEPIVFNGKIAEEIGFDKIRKQLAELGELKIVLLDGLLVKGVLSESASEDEYERMLEKIEASCPKIVELDLSRNLLESWKDVADICARLKRLKALKLTGNRFRPLNAGLTFEDITQLSLDQTLMDWDEVAAVTYSFPSLKMFSASFNELTSTTALLSNTITDLHLDFNDFDSIYSIRHLSGLTNLSSISVSGNNISAIGTGPEQVRFPPGLTSLDISFNRINSWSFIDSLISIFPGLTNLRISDNPLYQKPPAPSSITGLPEKPMTVDETYMLTLARIGQLKVLNYCHITPQERMNGELYYLSLIRRELAAYPEPEESRILHKHPRYEELCHHHGAPVVERTKDTDGINPNSLAARLVTLTFYRLGKDEQEYTAKIPKTIDVYRLKNIVARKFALMPLRFRLIWETDEFDPDEKMNADEDEWDSSTEEDDGGKFVDTNTIRDHGGRRFIRREEELVDSTREIEYWFSKGVKAGRVRIEPF